MTILGLSPIVRLIQVASLGCMLFSLRTPHRDPGRVELSLALLGERELPDGSWQGADLLARPEAPAQRFQLTLRPDRDLRVVLEARAPDGTVARIFPAPGKEGVLAHGQSYALPGPQAFYALEGKVLLVLTASPVRASSLPATLVRALALEPGPPLPLSDGARVQVQSARLAAQGPLRLELPLSDR